MVDVNCIVFSYRHNLIKIYCIKLELVHIGLAQINEITNFVHEQEPYLQERQNFRTYRRGFNARPFSNCDY